MHILPFALKGFALKMRLCYQFRARYFKIYGGETGLTPIMYVMGINILSYLVTGGKIGLSSVQVL